MEMESTNIRGICLDMCPEEEYLRRTNLGSIHVLETESCSKSSNRKAIRNQMVKEFVRSAAGSNLTEIKTLRPPHVLYRTVLYLLDVPLRQNLVRWPVVYEFISDRLRSVRQDAVVQRINSEEWKLILPPMVRFYCYSAYRLLGEISVSLELNRKQLNDCIVMLIIAYGGLGCNSKKYDPEMLEMETLYSLINIENICILTRYAQIYAKYSGEREHISNITLHICRNYIIQNFIRVLRTLNQLPLLHRGVFYGLHIGNIRRYLLQVISFASCSGRQKLPYPVSKLKDMLLFDAEEDIVEQCDYYGIEFNKDKRSFLFQKDISFMDKELMPLKRNIELDDCLKDINLSQFLLGS